MLQEGWFGLNLHTKVQQCGQVPAIQFMSTVGTNAMNTLSGSSNMGGNVFAGIAADLSKSAIPAVVTISSKQYQTWRQCYLFDAIRHLRYGQSFCNTFNITDYILFYEQDAAWVDEYIKQNYLLDGTC
jgi:hypothetical protein